MEHAPITRSFLLVFLRLYSHVVQLYNEGAKV